MQNSRAFLHITYKLYGYLDKLSGTKKSNCLNCYLSLMKHAWKKNNYECGLRYSTVAKETKICTPPIHINPTPRVTIKA